jgi:glucuronoarabinoxylan endo-1,4-beta-xylanase
LTLESRISFRFNHEKLANLPGEIHFMNTQSTGKSRLKTLGFIVIVGWAVSHTSLLAQICIINTSSTFQSIDGFGASSAFADPVGMTSAQAATMFGTNSGQMGLSMWRVRIDPNKNWTTETANSAFAHQYGAKVLGSAWTPPASMKTNDNTIGGSLSTTQYAAYATYLNQAANSIGLDYVSMQNEPDAVVTYESCFWTGSTMETWCANNAPAVGRPIVMPESQSFDHSFSDPTLADSTAAGNITIVAGHLYGGLPFGPYTTALNLGKHVWMTEHYDTLGSTHLDMVSSNILSAVFTAHEISVCMNQQMSAYIWWRAYHPTPQYDDLIEGNVPNVTACTLAQFSKFIRPGYVMVSATFSPTLGIFTTAYTGNSSLVIVAVNTNASPVSQAFSISGTSATSMVPTITSTNQSLAEQPAIPVASGNFTATLPAESTTTFVSMSPPMLFNPILTNGVFGFSFTDGVPVRFTVLTATNLSLALSNWTVVGSPTNTGGNTYSFSIKGTNPSAQFYRVQYP